MDFRGVFENGVIRPTEPTPLPEGTVVQFHAVEQNDSARDRLIRESDAAARSDNTLEQIAADQGVQPLGSISELRGDWPEEDDIDEFFNWLHRSRAA
ncbi:MAG: antitoxin family protein [Phycisphaeraceae bacterium]|nr:antitoxin family protein [Phycisphaeraceae bacterium]